MLGITRVLAVLPRSVTLTDGGKMSMNAVTADKKGTPYVGFQVDGAIKGGKYDGLQFQGFKYGIRKIQGGFEGFVSGPVFGDGAEVSGKVEAHGDKGGHKFWIRVCEGPLEGKFLNGYLTAKGWAVVRGNFGDTHPEFEACTHIASLKRKKDVQLKKGGVLKAKNA